MKVLSLFDGISCGRVALDRLNIFPDEYYASEIDKNAIAISKVNWPDIKHVGSITDIRVAENGRLTYKEQNGVILNVSDNFKPFDLIMGGSPCQDLSIIKSKTRKSLDGEKSNLFYEFVRLVKELQPRYFLLENNFSMKDEARDIISKEMGVQPIMIDSGLVSAQDRKRYYWTNIPQSPLKDKGIMSKPSGTTYILNDILQPADEVDDKYWYHMPFEFYGEDKKVCATLEMKNQEMHKRVFSKNFKCGTLTTCGGGNTQKKVYQDGRVRKLTPLEYERLQTLPDDYTSGFADSHRYNGCGNGWTVDVIAHILENAFIEFA